MSSHPTSSATGSVAPAHHDENQLMVERREKLSALRQHQADGKGVAFPNDIKPGHRAEALFAEYSHTVAQLLVTWEDFDHPHRLHNLQNTLERLIQLGAVPVINENDPISTEEYSLGDNDRLGALIAKYTHADLLVLLSDIDGLYTADPHTHPEATLIHRVESVTPEIEQLGGGSNSGLGTGGMSAKLTAAKIATGAGVDMVIANGANANVLYDIVDGKDVGTRFVGKNNK